LLLISFDQSSFPFSLKGSDEYLPPGCSTLLWRKKEDHMLLTVAILLFILWALGLFAFNIGGGLIHLLVVLAVIVLISHLLGGRRRLV
jgi:hypothetical protein